MWLVIDSFWGKCNMPQVVVCAGCTKKFKAADPLAGKKVRCPICQTVLSIPAIASSTATETPSPQPTRPLAASETVTPPVPVPRATSNPAKPQAKPKESFAFPFDNDEDLRLAPEMPPANPPPHVRPAAAAFRGQQPHVPSAVRVPTSASGVRLSTRAPSNAIAARRRPRMIYACFALAFLPLLFLVQSEKEDIYTRIEHTITAHPNVAERFRENSDEATLESVFDALPEGKLDDAHLARHSWMHWVYAVVAALIFLAAIRLLFEPGRSTSIQLILVGITTATVGILLLIMFQWLAELSQVVWLHGGNIVVLLIFYIIKFIGWSYHAALDPDNGFLLSIIGFTFGVGLCEEIVKAIPILCATNMERKLDWRGACAWGLASGVGFGVAEGIMYSSSYYNGIAGFDVYLVRFISCVALHATWTAAVAIMIWQNEANLEQDTWYEWLAQLLLLISVPMTLHGLYDTLLKREMKVYALLVAAASFAWLVFLIERARSGDEEEPGLVGTQLSTR